MKKLPQKPVLPQGYVNKGRGAHPVRTANDEYLPPLVEKRMPSAVIEAVFAADRFRNGQPLADLIESGKLLTRYDRYVIADYIRRMNSKSKPTTPVYDWTERDKLLERAAERARNSMRKLGRSEALTEAAEFYRISKGSLEAHFTNASQHKRKMRRRWAGPK